MANINPANPSQNDIEALKKFAEAPPLQPVEPRQEVSADQADKEALRQYAKEHAAEVLSPHMIAPKTEVKIATPLPSAQEVRAMEKEKDKAMIEVEKLLEKDLADTWKNLPDNIKPFFKSHGEKIAQTVSGMVKNKSFDSSIVMELVDDWLKLIPKSNRSFLEQTAKLKTDALVKYFNTAIQDQAIN